MINRLPSPMSLISRGARHADGAALRSHLESTRELALDLAGESRERAEVIAQQGRRRVQGALEGVTPTIRRAIDEVEVPDAVRDAWSRAATLPPPRRRRRRRAVVLIAAAAIAIVAVVVLARRGADPEPDDSADDRA